MNNTEYTPKNRCYFTGYVKSLPIMEYKDENSLSKPSYTTTLFIETNGKEQSIQLRFEGSVAKNALTYIQRGAILNVKAEYISSEFTFNVVFFKVIGFKVGYYNNDNQSKIMVDK